MAETRLALARSAQPGQTHALELGSFAGSWDHRCDMDHSSGADAPLGRPSACFVFCLGMGAGPVDPDPERSPVMHAISEYVQLA
jgi:hypothetical protein